MLMWFIYLKHRIREFLWNLFADPAPQKPAQFIERPIRGNSAIQILNRPHLLIHAEDDQKLWLNIRECPQEISGLALAEYDRHLNTITIYDLTLLEQKVSSAMTDLDQIAIGKLITEMISRNRDTGLLKVWWHSHVRGEVYWSQHQDEVTIENLKDFGFDFLISMVGNVFGELRCRLDIFEPLHITLDNLPIRIIHPPNPDLLDRVREEIENKVQLSGGLY